MDAEKCKVPDRIGEMRIIPLTESIYLKPFRAEFDMNGRRRYWDFLRVHDSVAILIHNVSRNVLVLVRQFRPAMYLAQVKSVESGSVIDTKRHDLSKGYSIELCAGIVDKDLELAEVARQEVLEECGYDVPASCLRKIFSFRNVGVTGQQNTIFFAEVTDRQKVSNGGGLRDEGEFIEVVEMTIADVRKYIESEDILSPSSFVAAVQWFLRDRKDFD